MQQDEVVVKLKLDELVSNTYQPREIFNDNTLKELSTSIKEYGVLNPILVRQKDGKYEIIAGERRVKASKLAGLTEIPAIIKNVEDSKMAEMALIENLQRENLNPIEEAKSYKKILELTNITEQTLSEMIGKSQSFISNKIRLLSLPDDIQKALINKKISEKHARTLLMLDDENKQKEILTKIINEKLSVKELEKIIKSEKEETLDSAIDDIVESLKITEQKNKEEEKESDNMNNGSFFPNMNNTNPENASLNAMNMQTMNTPQTPPNVEITPMNNQPIEIQNPIPEFNSAVQQPQMMPIPEAPVINEPINVNPQPANMEMPTYNMVPPQPEPMPQAPVEQPLPEPTEVTPNIDIPLFNNPSVQPDQTSAPMNYQPLDTIPTPEMPVEAPTPAVEIAPEAPLFPQNNEMPQNQGMNMTPQPAENNLSYEVPVTAEVDNFTRIKDLLNSNGIDYKAYSNEDNHCIIIEL